MTPLAAGRELPERTLLAHNYAEDSENKIHSDETARAYGFRGGLVPGIGACAYLMHPIAAAWGRDWVEGGTFAAKLLKPVYHGDRVATRARVADDGGIGAQLFDSVGELCAAARAALAHAEPPPAPADYPKVPLPAADAQLAPTCAAVRAGILLGSREFIYDQALAASTFVRDMREDLSLFSGAGALCHPAFALAQANYIARDNIALGPWIHAASEAWHFGAPRDGEPVSLRGRVAESFEKRGHDFAVLDLALFGDGERPLAKIRHTAIIRPRRADA